MSLVRLLSAGKSLVGLKECESRYKMGDPRALPKFLSAKNPFMGEGDKEDGGSIEKIVQLAKEAAEKAPRSKLQAPNFNQRVGKIRSLMLGASLELGARGLRFLRLFRRKDNGMPKKEIAPKAGAITRFDSAPVQGELSLDRVKVIRNDLSDTDFEIVPGGTERVRDKVGGNGGDKVHDRVGGSGRDEQAGAGRRELAGVVGGSLDGINSAPPPPFRRGEGESV